ncbi:hypothetical protein Zmor_025678 [Zophobas morio]|uniref:Cytochrome P450 n=1 Tax=Zophobas morio TaxID=2755281 RepID=A0AA38HTT6_9CUCU|nr:hypothetical protein Zmor_025678 [Zophobas morio]
MLFNCDLSHLLAVSATLIAIVFAYFKWSFQYWQRRNLNYLKPKFPFGNAESPLRPKEYMGFRIKRYYDNMKAKGWKHGGLYLITSPRYMVVDLDYLKNIMSKDFDHFVDRGLYYNEKDDPLSAHLFALSGQKWRKLRAKLTPTFTSGKMKMMFQTLVDCLPNLLQKIEADCVPKAPIDIKETLGCFTTDIIGSCAFGLDCNTFKEENSPFREYGRKGLELTPSQVFRLVLSTVWPNMCKFFRLTLTSKDVSAFFLKLIKDTVDYRETNTVTRNDFLQILIDLKNKSSEGLSFEEIAAQCFVFFLAGFETSSTTMTFLLYELSRRPELQEKVRDEINTVLKNHDGIVTYEAIQEMKYMDQVINETLRMYPPLAFLNRECVKDYKVPGEDVIIEKGTAVTISVLGIHYDEEYYPEPEKFDPERFNDENKRSRHQYAHIPFGEGPRICIGMRFGLMQSKVGLTALLRQYKFTVNKKTQEPLKMKPGGFIMSVQGEIWLTAEKIEN